jgi:RNA-directed DNA polymerase
MSIQHTTFLREGNLEKLRHKALPECNTDEEIALAMGISVEKLRFLAFNPLRSSPTTHYFYFPIKKKTGEERKISAPMPDLKAAQRWILKNILEKLELHEAAHGFCQNRSIVTNAKPHVSASAIVKIDLEDFFGSISYKRVKELFNELGYSEAAATIFGLICTIGQIKDLEKRHLPQGSPASPAISNLICFSLDRRLATMAKNLDFFYTRYADDLTFSCSENVTDKISNLIKESKLIINNEGFQINPDKTQILTQTVQQQVTGIVVNKKLNISRKTLKAFRATLYQIEQEGLSNKTWSNSPNLIASITGFANYVSMVNPSKGLEFLAAIERIKQKYGGKG